MKLVVEVIDVHDLVPKDGQGSDSPFVEVDFENQLSQTRTVQKSLNHIWNQKLLFHLDKTKTTITNPFKSLFTTRGELFRAEIFSEGWDWPQSLSVTGIRPNSLPSMPPPQSTPSNPLNSHLSETTNLISNTSSALPKPKVSVNIPTPIKKKPKKVTSTVSMIETSSSPVTAANFRNSAIAERSNQRASSSQSRDNSIRGQTPSSAATRSIRGEETRRCHFHNASPGQ